MATFVRIYSKGKVFYAFVWMAGYVYLPGFFSNEFNCTTTTYTQERLMGE